MKKVFVLVLDGFGVGSLPDWRDYNEGEHISNSFLNVEKIKPYNIPNMEKLGLKNIDGNDIHKSNSVIGYYGKLQEISNGKDTTTGHFEMMDIITQTPSPTFPDGFPNEIVQKLEKLFGCKILCNKPASGTEVIKRLGDEHIRTKCPIVYTSADSVLQIACHTDIYSLEELYYYCEKTREFMVGKYAVGRVIARPFATINGEYTRLNKDRKDFSLLPPEPNTLSRLVNNGFECIGVGKIKDIFAGKGLTKCYENHTNAESLEVSKKLSKQELNGLVFVNLVDTDMIYGHRNDIDGYRMAIEKVDEALTEIIGNLNDKDLLIITGDHGCDPTTPSTDHSREYVPFLVYSKSMKSNGNLGTLLGINNVGKVVEQYLIANENIDDIMEKLC